VYRSGTASNCSDGCCG